MHTVNLTFVVLVAILIVALLIYFFRRRAKQKQVTHFNKHDPLINAEVDLTISFDKKEINLGGDIDFLEEQKIKIEDDFFSEPKETDLLSSAETAAISTAPSDALSSVEIIKFTYAPDTLIFKIKSLNGQPFMGYELLQTLFDAGFGFGEMDIFHYHDVESLTAPAIFRLAAATESGKFELNSIGSLRCPGLIVFMDLKEQKSLLNAFDCMLLTMEHVAEDLGAILYDAEDNILTAATAKDIRDKIAILEEKKYYAQDLLSDSEL